MCKLNNSGSTLVPVSFLNYNVNYNLNYNVSI